MANSGSKGERDVCKYLSKGVNGTEKPIVYGRSAGSGSVFTVSEGEAGKEFAGDIYCVREEGKPLTDKFSIECKSGYDNASLDKHLKYNKADPIVSFGNQCIEDATMSNKYPMLIFKKKGFPVPGLGISTEAYNKLQNNFKYIRSVHLSWEGLDLPDIYFFSMYDFFNNISLSIINKYI